MSRKTRLLENLTLKGLTLAPPQICGAVRLVPICRAKPSQDLRLYQRPYSENLTMVDLGYQEKGQPMGYFSYVPHGLVLNWSEDGSPVVTRGGQLLKQGSSQSAPKGVNLLHRMVKRESAQQLRLLPLHVAMEGFLSLYFSGPEIAWQDYSRSALSQGLGERWEITYSGRGIAGLEAALRLFEIHEQQVGVLMFVAEALASAFVVPTPADYRALHSTLLSDFYGELIYQYGQLFETLGPLQPEVAAQQVHSLADIAAVIDQLRQDWASFSKLMSLGLFRDLRSQRVYTIGPFSLQRFITQLDPKSENHMGEVIIRETGEIEYLKTYRLSGTQTRRAYLLSRLALYGWDIDETAKSLNHSREELILRLENAGFGYLIKQNVREQAQAKRRRGLT
jgi:hypothetical protein